MILTTARSEATIPNAIVQMISGVICYNWYPIWCGVASATFFFLAAR